MEKDENQMDNLKEYIRFFYNLLKKIDFSCRHLLEFSYYFLYIC